MSKALFLLWIFVCAFTASAQTVTEGSLFAIGQKGTDLGACPLKTTAVKTDISGFIARVTVRQEFENKFTEPIEAIYTFPLSQKGAVDRMTMTVGTRVIHGEIKRREEARAIYESAKSAGQTASLLDQERPNIFTQAVANIMPGEGVIVEISYVETLKYEDGAYEFVFPMTIAPRYNPLSVKDAAKISPPVVATRNGSDISIEVNLNAGVPVEEIRSTSHDIDQVNITPSTAKVTLRGEKTIPNKDFILRYDVTGKRIEDAVLAHADERGKFFTLVLQPPDKIATEDRTPKEIVFVLDTSGSMGGFPIEKAKEAMKLSLDGLYPDDTFNLITFAGDTAILFDKPVPATQANLDMAQQFLAGRSGGGGTEMMKAIKASLDPTDAADHLRIVCFMTDGVVGNDDEIIAEVQRHPNARVFSFGIGSSVNHNLLDRIASEGKGEAEYVGLNDDGSAAAKRFYERVRTPLLTDLSIDWNGMPVADMYPNKLTDLFSAKPVILHGRYTQAASGTIKLRGKVAGQPYERDIKIDLPDSLSDNDVLSTLWARTRIDDISSARINADEKKGVALDNEATDLGLKFGIMTSFTSFVAVEDRVVNVNGQPKTVQVPVVLPEGTQAEVYKKWLGNDVAYVVDGTDKKASINGLRSSNGYFAFVPPPPQTTGTGTGAGFGGGTGSGSGGGGGGGGRSQTATGSVGTTITARQVQSLPVNGRALSQMAYMSPPAKMVSGGVLNGKAISLPKPKYPAGARAVNASGRVSIRVVIDEKGKVVSARAISGHPLLRAASVAAANRSTFSPTLRSGAPVKVSGVISYNFGSSGVARSVRLSTPAAGEEPTIATPPPPPTPEMLRDQRLKSKLHFWLYALVTRLAKGDKTAGPNEPLFVKDGKASIRVELTARSQEVLDKLKTAGFEVVGDKGKLILVGSIAIDKLAALADIEEVKLILPQI